MELFFLAAVYVGAGKPILLGFCGYLLAPVLVPLTSNCDSFLLFIVC